MKKGKKDEGKADLLSDEKDKGKGEKERKVDASTVNQAARSFKRSCATLLKDALRVDKKATEILKDFGLDENSSKNYSMEIALCQNRQSWLKAIMEQTPQNLQAKIQGTGGLAKSDSASSAAGSTSRASAG